MTDITEITWNNGGEMRTEPCSRGNRRRDSIMGKIEMECSLEDRKILLCVEGFFAKVREEFEKMCEGEYELGFYIWRREK